MVEEARAGFRKMMRILGERLWLCYEISKRRLKRVSLNVSSSVPRIDNQNRKLKEITT